MLNVPNRKGWRSSQCIQGHNLHVSVVYKMHFLCKKVPDISSHVPSYSCVLNQIHWWSIWHLVVLFFLTCILWRSYAKTFDVSMWKKISQEVENHCIHFYVCYCLVRTTCEIRALQKMQHRLHSIWSSHTNLECFPMA